MSLNQKGGFLLPSLIIIAILAGIVLIHLLTIPKESNSLPAPIQPQSVWQLPSIPPQPSYNPEDLVPIPDLAKFSTAPQIEFKGGMDFPFTFTYPDHFEKNIIDVEKRKLEVRESNPKYVWRLLNQVSIGVSLSNSKYDYSDCSSVMRISISKYANIDHTSLYDFIKTINAQYPGNGITETFETYKKGLTVIDYPKQNSYQFIGNLSENPAKTVYFEHGDSFYSFSLYGGCNTGEGYSKDAENLFDTILHNMKFK